MDKRLFKSALGAGLLALPPIRRKLKKRDTAHVLAFHRVNDEIAEDGLTISSRKFERICAVLSENFDVVDPIDIVENLSRGSNLAGKVAITFDDGYRDNYEYAAPLLEKYNLPATFFIATQFIGSDHVPRWDEKLDTNLGWMDWAMIQDLTARGFDIQPHTQNHVDLGTVSAEEAKREIMGSINDIRRITGKESTLFAYPYGGEKNMCETNLACVKQTGIAACFSCFGGFVEKGDDPFRLRRRPVASWYVSASHLAFDLDLAL